MLKRKTSARKFKRTVKRAILMSVLIVGVIVLSGSIAYYLVSLQFKKPLYVSPISSKQPLTTNQESGVADDNMGVLKKSLNEKHISFSSVTASHSSYLVALKQGGMVTFSSEKDILNQVSSLQFILSRLTMEGKLFSQLDLRFDKPVIRE